MLERTIEDRLREEYFELLPDIRRVAEHLEAEVKYYLLPISRQLDMFERLVVTSRIKECESALEALRRRQEGATFDRDRPELYTLSSLNDLAGVRVLAFPRTRLAEIDLEVRKRFSDWNSDPVPGYNETNELRSNTMVIVTLAPRSEVSYRSCQCLPVYFGKSNIQQFTSLRRSSKA